MSDTYKAAVRAKELLNNNDVIVIDSSLVSASLGLLVLKACNFRDNGLDIYQIEKELKSLIPHIKSVYVFNSLNNLVIGGRIFKTAGTIGNMFGIKLIIQCEDSEIKIISKVRGDRKAIEVLVSNLKRHGSKDGEICVLMESDNKDILPVLKEELI